MKPQEMVNGPTRGPASRVTFHVNREPAQLFIDEYHVADYDIDGVEALRDTAILLLNLHMYVRPEIAVGLRTIAGWCSEQADRLILEYTSGD